MKITGEERFALRMLFRGTDATSIVVRSQLDQLEVTERRETGVGILTTMRLPMRLNNLSQRQWDWNFEHRYLSHGGSFMCWLEDSSVLDLEAVTHSGNWPDRFDPTDFIEAE